MDEKEIIKRNIDRLNTRLNFFIRAGAKEQKEDFIKNYKIMSENKEYKLDDIDFNKSIIFVCNDSFLAFLSYFGLLRVNNIKLPDTTIDGTYSFIRKSYMVINSDEIRFSKIPQEHFYDEHRDSALPESWNSINFVTKDICIWRLINESGMQDSNKMYSACCSWIEDRYYTGKVDWIFYIGDMATLNKTYSTLLNLKIPIYEIMRKGNKVKEEKQTDKAKKVGSNGKGDLF